MDHLEFLYLSFFITAGGFILGFLSGWISNNIFSVWHDNAAYSKSILHPEMLDEDGNVLRDELIYLTFGDEDDMMDDEDE
jgi:hypothetical protein